MPFPTDFLPLPDLGVTVLGDFLADLRALDALGEADGRDALGVPGLGEALTGVTTFGDSDLDFRVGVTALGVLALGVLPFSASEGPALGDTDLFLGVTVLAGDFFMEAAAGTEDAGLTDFGERDLDLGVDFGVFLFFEPCPLVGVSDRDLDAVLGVFALGDFD